MISQQRRVILGAVLEPGVSRASLGLNPGALQATTAAAVNATISGAAGQVEVMARNLAEGGMKQLFRLILQIVSQHDEPGKHMRLDGNFVPVDPRSWRVDMDMEINVGLANDIEDALWQSRQPIFGRLGR